MKNFTKYVQNTNSLHGLWNRGDTIVVGASGGRDSMCLLHVLSHIANKEGLTIVAAHVNHGLRGASSDRDQKIVEDFCVQLNIPCETLVVDASKKGQSEDQWRTIRRDFFARVSSDYNAHSVALGHHKNDHAETLLLHLLRGSGLSGLSNMSVKSAQTIGGSPVVLIRPLLGVKREDISIYCTDYSIEFGEDETNSSTDFTRNKIRMMLLPYLEKNYNTEIIDTLSRTAQSIGDDYAFLSENVRLSYVNDENSVSFDKQEFLALSPSAQRFFLRSAVGSLINEGSYGGFGLIEEFRKALLSKKNKNQTIQTNDLIFAVKNATVEITLAI